jgi:hypothetical protein
MGRLGSGEGGERGMIEYKLEKFKATAFLSFPRQHFSNMEFAASEHQFFDYDQLAVRFARMDWGLEQKEYTTERKMTEVTVIDDVGFTPIVLKGWKAKTKAWASSKFQKFLRAHIKTKVIEVESLRHIRRVHMCPHLDLQSSHASHLNFVSMAYLEDCDWTERRDTELIRSIAKPLAACFLAIAKDDYFKDRFIRAMIDYGPYKEGDKSGRWNEMYAHVLLEKMPTVLMTLESIASTRKEKAE